MDVLIGEWEVRPGGTRTARSTHILRWSWRKEPGERTTLVGVGGKLDEEAAGPVVGKDGCTLGSGEESREDGLPLLAK
jgi:hypothetical protein